ncbi:MAG: TrkA family potassium uptake protein [Eubacterium sp.]|nr:TrkA family potassium uptake protein [Eubacterium sp.]
MKRKSFVMIGAGQFGANVARTLASSGAEVMVVDEDENALEDVADFVTHSVCADASNPEVIRQLGISNYDGAIIGIGRKLEPNVLITIQMKELGIPYVVAMARDDLEERVLRKVGADRVVTPDRDMGIRLGNQLMNGSYFDTIELSENYSIIEYISPDAWNGKTIKDLDVRNKYGVNIIGVRDGQNIDINPKPDYVLPDDCELVVLGHNNELKKLPGM